MSFACGPSKRHANCKEVLDEKLELLTLGSLVLGRDAQTLICFKTISTLQPLPYTDIEGSSTSIVLIDFT
jgi:hypothetical protein